jgi:BlaI family transcriptional regulator, penicillinase repressor
MSSAKQSLISWLGIKPRPARAPALGRRELAVLDILWQHGELAAQEVLMHMPTSSIGLSTVQTTLERLCRKQLLIRCKSGRAFRYRAAISKADVISKLLHDIAAEIAGGDTTVMVSGFMDYMAGAAPKSGIDNSADAIRAEESDD